ncbi:MAG: hypothetical protein R3B40_24550 [Polyangiales bacterium]|nr:hypothetical protein [Myxococcales bacterium]MCB9659551.1 hypothetical protein [Sandaracinaceae bacterium]
MSTPLLCAKCGAPLAAHAANSVVTCAFCGTTSAPAPRVVERVVDRVVVVAAEGAESTDGVPCPRCAKIFSRVSGGGDEALACAKCGGAFLTPAQVTAMQQTRNEGLARAVRRVSAVFMALEPRQAVLSCPTCQGALRMEEIEGSVHLMHVCKEHGTFFEMDALDTYMELWTEKRAGEVTDEDLESLGVSRKGFFSFLKR